MLFEALVLGIIVGLIFKGKINNLSNIQIKKVPLFFAGFIVRYLPRIPFISDINIKPLPENSLSPIFFIISYILIISGICFNLKYKFFIVALIGIIMNFLVVIANGGFMPVNHVALKIAEYPLSEIVGNLIDPNHIISDANTKLMFLGDFIPLTKPYPVNKILSIGDIVMSFGVFGFIFTKMKSKEENCN